MKDLRGKFALITGGDSGIGLGIARAFLGVGMRVAITYRTPEHLALALAALEGSKGRVLAIELDVTDRSAVAAAVEGARGAFGNIHVLVNNAGVAPLVPLSNATFDDWDWCLDVNVNGVFNCVQAVLPHMRQHGEDAHIVATSSMVGGIIVGPYWGVYSTSKFAVVGMMEALRAELAHLNIGVSIFCPGSVQSRINLSDRNRPDTLSDSGQPDDELSLRINCFHRAMFDAIVKTGGEQPLMDPLEAGSAVLRGIQSDDLYIFSHPEYAQALADRNEALMASILNDNQVKFPTRIAMAEVARNPIYTKELAKRRRP